MDQRPTTISELESDLQRALAALVETNERGDLPGDLKPLLLLAPPDGASVHVSLRQRDSGRQLRLGAPVQSWSQRSCGVWVVYEVAPGPGGVGSPQLRGSDGSGDPMQDFISALDRVEKDPHLHFVSLKWFRDTYLPKRGYDWADDPDLPRQMVHEAAEAGMILTSKVPNPKTPEFPVTTISLNRAHPRVRRALEAASPQPPASDPVSADPRAATAPAAEAKRMLRRGSSEEGPREESVEA
jgi:hypothetical protein